MTKHQRAFPSHERQRPCVGENEAPISAVPDARMIAHAVDDVDNAYDAAERLLGRRAHAKRRSISSSLLASRRALAWISTGPRYCVGQVLFSMSLMPATIRPAQGWRIERILILRYASLREPMEKPFYTGKRNKWCRPSGASCERPGAAAFVRK